MNVGRLKKVEAGPARSAAYPETVTLFRATGSPDKLISAKDAKRLVSRQLADLVLDCGNIVGVIWHSRDIPSESKRKAPGINAITVQTMAGGSRQHYSEHVGDSYVFALKNVNL